MHPRTARIRRALSQAGSLQDQLDVLHDAYAGAEAVVVSCGPSLRSVSDAELRAAARGRVVVAVKQAMGRVGRDADVHLFNPYNFQRARYRNPTTIRVCCTHAGDPPYFGPRPHVELPLAVVDPDKEKAVAESLSSTECFEAHTLDKTPLRPWGPGIMYDAGIYLLVHLGIRKVVCVGWDIGPPQSTVLNHFYAEPPDDWPGAWRHVRASGRFLHDITNRVFRKARLRRRMPDPDRMLLHWRGKRYNVIGCYERENELIARSSGKMFEWLASRGVALSLASDCSYLSPVIPRCRLNDLPPVVTQLDRDS